MKTNLKQQLGLIDALVAEPSRPRRVVMFREWLKDHGYEDIGECKHYTLVRITGKCATCGVPVAEPITEGSDEALVALRERLRS